MMTPHFSTLQLKISQQQNTMQMLLRVNVYHQQHVNGTPHGKCYCKSKRKLTTPSDTNYFLKKSKFSVFLFCFVFLFVRLFVFCLPLGNNLRFYMTNSSICLYLTAFWYVEKQGLTDLWTAQRDPVTKIGSKGLVFLLTKL